MDRNIYLFGEINQELAADIISQINEIEDYDKKQVEDMETYNKPYIKLYINSDGGSVIDGLAIVDKILSCETPINTIALGGCMSAALIIFASGDLRTSGRFTQFMYHQVASDIFGQCSDLERQIEQTKHIQNLFDSVLLENTNLSEHILTTWKKLEQDMYFNAEKSLNYHICDEIL